MKKTIVVFTTIAVALLCIFQHSYAQDFVEAKRYAAMDKNRVFLVKVNESYVSDELANEGISKGYLTDVPVAMYKIVKEGYYTYCYGILFGEEIKLSFSSSFKFASSDDYEYLLKRGSSGADFRIVNARHLDKVQSAEYKKEVKSLAEQDKKESLELLQYFRKNRAIIWDYSVRRSYDDYTFYVEIMNWFPKNIKYVELKVAALNSVGDPRWYDKDETIRNVRCVGYIDSLEKGTFTFEDLYYDYYNQIDDVVVIGAVITFEDNSKISVTSEQAVQKLYYDNHDVSLPENFWDLVQ